MPKPLPRIQRYDLDEYGLTADLPEYLDSSMLKDFADCPSKFYLRHVLGLRPKGQEEPSYFAWGNMWHEVMFTFHHNRNLTEALDVLEEQWPHEILHEHEKKARTQERMRRLLFEYAEKYDKKDTTEWNTLHREQVFELWCPPDESSCPFGGCDLRWSGRIDRVVERVPVNKVVVWDYKTSSRDTRNYYDEHKYGFQMPGYIWAAIHLTTQEDIAGVVIDRLYATKTKDWMERREIRLTDYHIKDWLDNVKRLRDEIHFMWENYPEDPEAWTKNKNECYRYNGCMFTGVHELPPIRDTRYRSLENDFVEDRWDPAELLEG